MKKAIKAVGRFVYRVSGLRAVVSCISSAVLRYRLRVRMVPSSYKVFVWGLGLITGATGMFLFASWEDFTAGQSIVFENVQALEVVEVVEPVEWQSAIFTSYSAGDGYTPGITMASGRKVYVGAVACPRDMALGTKIQTEDGRTLTCEDRKAIRFNGEFDIYASTVDEALQFGRKTVKFKIVK